MGRLGRLLLLMIMVVPLAACHRDPWVIGDRVWLDADRDGIQDPGEPGFGDVEVVLRCREWPDGFALQCGRTRTGEDGGYSFRVPSGPGVEPDAFRVVVRTADHGISPQNRGVDDAADSDLDPGTFTSDEVVFQHTSGTGMTADLDVGLIAYDGAIGGIAWLDVDRDGVRDPDELGREGVTVYLDREDFPGWFRRAVTGTDGRYLFEGLPPATYSLEFDAPFRYTFGPRDQGDDALDSDVDADGHTAPITLGPDERIATVDASLVSSTPSISGVVFEDANRNGAWESPEENPVAAVRITLTDGSGTPVNETATNNLGRYTFASLEPGTYAVGFALPDGFRFTAKDQAVETLDSDADPQTGRTDEIVLGPEDDVFGVNAGIFEPDTGTIGDRVWDDRDADGIQDETEPGLAGVTVSLRDIEGVALATTTTDDAGGYAFDGLAAGIYRVHVERLPGWFYVTMDAGGDDSRDSDVDRSTGATDPIGLAEGQTDLTIDAGLTRAA